METDTAKKTPRAVKEKVRSYERIQVPFRLDEKVYVDFKTKCKAEARNMNTVLSRLVEMYNTGRIKL